MRRRHTVLVALALAIASIPTVVLALHHSHHPADTSRAAASGAPKTPLQITTQPAPTASDSSSSPTLPPLAATASWQTQCPHGYHFCADFPGLNFQPTTYDAGTSRQRVSFESTVYIARDGRFCTTDADVRCHDTSSETYFVQVIPGHGRDPWTALTSPNGGIVNPVGSSVQGNLAAKFERGIYGGPGITVWHNSQVYYAEAINDDHTRTRFVEQFLASLRFTS